MREKSRLTKHRLLLAPSVKQLLRYSREVLTKDFREQPGSEFRHVAHVSSLLTSANAADALHLSLFRTQIAIYARREPVVRENLSLYLSFSPPLLLFLALAFALLVHVATGVIHTRG